MPHQNEELLRRYFKAAESNDVATLDELFADDVVGHTTGNHELSGDHRGKEAVFALFGRLAELSGGTARLTLRDAIADDSFAVALVDAHGRVGDNVIDGEPTVMVLRIADGRFVEWWSHHYDQPKMDALWSS
ncbi:MAG TPA: nuclear transport factor 2 family protein [Jiangellaceae bacterium]